MRVKPRGVVLSAILLAVSGCGFNDGSSPAVLTGEFTLSATSVWAGDTIRISSPDLEFLKHVMVEVGDDSLAVVSLDPTTVAVTMPATLAGSFTPRLLAEGQVPVTLSAIQVYGYLEHRSYTTWFDWGEMTVFPRNTPNVMGGLQEDALGFVNLETHAERQTDTIFSSNWLRRPGPTPDPTVFLLRARLDTLVRAWRLSGPVPVLVDSFPGEATSFRHMMLLSTGHWFRGYHHTYQVDDRLPVTAEESEGVFLSPRGDRATIMVDAIPGGLEVFDAATGGVAYRLPLQQSDGVWFSDDGEVLAVVGKAINDQPESRVLLVRSSDGEVLGDTTLSGHAFGITMDGSRPYLYVAELQADGRPALLVLSSENLAFIARLPVPLASPACDALDDCYKGVIAVGRNRAFIASSFNTRLQAWTFALPAP
jgi:hypothetical protein